MTFWVAGAVVVGSAVSAYSADKAAGRQQDAANNATQATRDQNAQTRADTAPWRDAGKTALGSIADLMGTSGNTGAANYGSLQHQFNADDLKSNLAPNYQFQLQQGLGAATNAGNAAGFSGNTLKGINDYAQGYAGNAYQQAFSNYTANQTNIYNRLSNLAGLGQTANQIDATAGTANTLNGGNFLTSGANARASGIVGVGNAVSNGIGSYAGWNYLNGSQNPYTTPSSSGSYSNPVGGGEGIDPWGNLGGSTSAGDYSDERLKTDISRIGTTDAGLPVYTYRYKAGGPMRMGVMAQEVEQVAPEAVSHDRQGWKKVNYGLLRDIGLTGGARAH